MSRCAIYARFSTDRQSATSAEDQIAICSTRAKREGWEIAGVYTDAAISGASNRRPGMTAMLSDASAGVFDIVLAEALDRIARNQADIATIFQALEFADVAIETLTEGRISELHIGLKGTMGALFLKDLADKIRRGQRGAVGRGRVPGGLTYGYDVVSQLNGKGELDRGLRRINPDQAAIVLRVYQEYSSGSSPKMIAKRLNADGVPSPRGGEWRASTLSGNRERGIGVLCNPIYAGRYLYNRVSMRRDPESRRRVSRPNATDDRVSIEMPDLRIVPEDLWRAAQEQAEQRTTGPIGSRQRPRYLLTGLVRCGRCGGTMAVIGGGRIGCTRAREAGTCDVAATIGRAELERRVLAGLADRLLEPEAVSRLVKSYHREVDARQGERAASIGVIQRRIDKGRRSIERLIDAIADGAADFRDVREALVARKAEIQTLERQRDEAGAVPVIALNPRVIEAYRQRVRELALHLDGGSAAGREVLERLRDLIDTVRCSPTNTRAWDVEVMTHLGGVVALATASRSVKASGFSRSVQVVAKEGLEPPTPGL